MPLGRIIHSYDDNDAALWNANFEEGVKIARATDAKEVWQGRAVQPTIHLMGGTIMGTGAANSVVNSFGQTHEIRNLYVAGPGDFCDRGRVEPDVYDLCAVAARGGESGGELAECGGVGSQPVFLTDQSYGPSFRGSTKWRTRNP